MPAGTLPFTESTRLGATLTTNHPLQVRYGPPGSVGESARRGPLSTMKGRAVPTIASLEVAVTGNTASVERSMAQTNALIDQLQRNSGAANVSFNKLTGSFSAGTGPAHAFMGAVGGLALLWRLVSRRARLGVS